MDRRDPKKLGLRAKDFEGLIRPSLDAHQRSICRLSIGPVLKWLEKLRPKMSNESVDITLEYLKTEKWVKCAATPAAHEHYKRAKGNGKRKKPMLFFPDLIIVLATFRGNRTVNTLVDEYSAHWGFNFSKDKPSYPSGLDPVTERRLFEGIAIEDERLTPSPAESIDLERKRKSIPMSGITLPTCIRPKLVSGPTRELSLESHSSSSYPADLHRVGYVTNPFQIPVKSFDLHSKSSDLQLNPSGNQDPVFDDECGFVLTPDQRTWYGGKKSKYKRSAANAESDKAMGVVSYPYGRERKSTFEDVDMTTKSTANSSTSYKQKADSSQLQPSNKAKDAYASSGQVTDQWSNSKQTRAHGGKHVQASSVLAKPQAVNHGVRPVSSSQHREEPNKQNGREIASGVPMAQCCKEIKDMTKLHQNTTSTFEKRAQQMVKDTLYLYNKNKERYERDILRYKERIKTQSNTINKLERELNAVKDVMVLRQIQKRRSTTHEPEYQTKSTSNDSFPMNQLIDAVKETMAREMAKGTEDIKTAVMILLDEAIAGDQNSTS
ncbi:hypothetical protein ACHAQD_011267 [Fusarium lateritium]